MHTNTHDYLPHLAGQKAWYVRTSLVANAVHERGCRVVVGHEWEVGARTYLRILAQCAAWTAHEVDVVLVRTVYYYT